MYIGHMKKLHEKQLKLLELLKDNSDSPLTIKDLRATLEITSPGILYHHLAQLEKKGYLKRNPNNSKDYVVIEKPESSVVYIGKYGTAHCGPNGVILDGNPIDYIAVATSLLRFAAKDAFIVEAKGDSMEPKIYEGDIIIAQKQTFANNGDIVVCSLNEEVKIKKYNYSKGYQTLVSLNDIWHDPIVVTEKDTLVIAGVVKNILSYNL